MTTSTVAAETRRTGRNALSGLTGAAANGVLGFVLTTVVVRSFGAAGSGTLFTAIAVASIAGALCCAGADTGLLYALPRQADRAGLLVVALLPALGMAIAVAVAGLLTADRFAAVVFGPSGPGAALLRVAAVTVPLTVAMTVLLACVRGLRPVMTYVAVQSGVLATTRPALVAAVAGMGTVAALVAWAAPVAVAALVALALVAGPLGLTRGVRWPAAAQWRSFWTFALPRGISAAIDASGVWVGVLLTNALAGPAQAGIFSAVGRYAMAGLLIMQGLRIAVAPQLSRLLSAGQAAGAAAVYRRATVFIIALSWPGYLVLAAFAPGFLTLFGHQFAGGAPALVVLCVAMLVNCGVGNAQTVLLMSGNSRRHLAATVGGLLVTVVLGLLLIPSLGALGAAYSWAAGVVVENVVVALAARAVLQVPIVNTSTALAAIGGLGVVALPVALGLLSGGRGVAGLIVTAGSLIVAACVLLAFPYARVTLRRLPSLITKEAR